MSRLHVSVTAGILFAFLLIASPVMAGEWVPAGSDQPGFRIVDIAVSGDGAYSALTGNGGIILLTADGTECWRSPEGGYRSVCLSENASILAAGGDGLCVLDKNGTVCATVRSRNYLNDVTITADGSLIVAVADDETLRLYTPSGDLIRSTETGDDLVSVAISPDGTYIAGGTVTGNVVLFSDAGEERWSYGLSRQPVTAVALADGARTIAAVSADGAFALLSRAGALLWSGSAPHAGGVAVTADGATAALADRQGIRFMERDGTPAGQITGLDGSVAAAMDSNGRMVAMTDGTRISGFVPKVTAVAEETPLPEQSPGEAQPDITTGQTQPHEGEGPVPTSSPFPLLPAGVALILSLGCAGRGLRC
ncbi:PQQ-binding-like beta-propeller repeat protein [Methanogenium sp. S4BF]|uniref:WD40 repeat domain-containing protein n=1 Tax=Methanogenium sp. S4BF TaxID=1789226 RepID=UPI00241604F7|nr:PQQ-binding-like beta-propeller repeat protein [Methanogenium sp. S4BF]WFN34043.1 PQQ-binding-like beta-propeller repeat protein [Methanogenium sp. S4BF]